MAIAAGVGGMHVDQFDQADESAIEHAVAAELAEVWQARLYAERAAVDGACAVEDQWAARLVLLVAVVHALFNPGATGHGIAHLLLG